MGFKLTRSIWRYQFYVNLARLESPFISSNTNLGVFVQVFSRCEPHLQLIDFMWRRYDPSSQEPAPWEKKINLGGCDLISWKVRTEVFLRKKKFHLCTAASTSTREVHTNTFYICRSRPYNHINTFFVTKSSWFLYQN